MFCVNCFRKKNPFGSNVLCVCFVDAQYLFAWDFNAHICACMKIVDAHLSIASAGKTPWELCFYMASVTALHVKLKLSMCASAPVISEPSFRKKTPWKPRCGLRMYNISPRGISMRISARAHENSRRASEHSFRGKNPLGAMF